MSLQSHVPPAASRIMIGGECVAQTEVPSIAENAQEIHTSYLGNLSKDACQDMQEGFMCHKGVTAAVEHQPEDESFFDAFLQVSDWLGTFESLPIRAQNTRI